MLVIKVLVNDTPIDTLYIHNTGKHTGDIYKYEIISRKTGKRLIPNIIKHKRSDGYRPLLLQALLLLEIAKNRKEFKKGKKSDK